MVGVAGFEPTTPSSGRLAPAYAEAVRTQGVPLDKAKEAAQHAVANHNAEETPLFAKDMERKARAGQWR